MERGALLVSRAREFNFDFLLFLKTHAHTIWNLLLVSMEVLAKSWQTLAILIKVDLKVPLKKKSVSLIFDLFLEK